MVQEAYVQGISTRSVDDLVRAMGMEGISKSQVSRLCGEIDERVQTFLNRPIEGEWPYVWLDATYVKARRDHHIVSVAVIVAVGVNTDGRREVLGMTVGHSEAEPFWVEFLRTLARRGLRGTKLVIPSSVCLLWQPEQAANAAQDTRSYTTSRGTIAASTALHLIMSPNSDSPTRISADNSTEAQAPPSGLFRSVRSLDGVRSAAPRAHPLTYGTGDGASARPVCVRKRPVLGRRPRPVLGRRPVGCPARASADLWHRRWAVRVRFASESVRFLGRRPVGCPARASADLWHRRWAVRVRFASESVRFLGRRPVGCPARAYPLTMAPATGGSKASEGARFSDGASPR